MLSSLIIAEWPRKFPAGSLARDFGTVQQLDSNSIYSKRPGTVLTLKILFAGIENSIWKYMRLFELIKKWSTELKKVVHHYKLVSMSALGLNLSLKSVKTSGPTFSNARRFGNLWVETSVIFGEKTYFREYVEHWKMFIPEKFGACYWSFFCSVPI